jgi:hypothetical protein
MKYRSLSLLIFTLFAIGSVVEEANASIIMTITDDGTNLTMRATGSYDFSSATPAPLVEDLGENAVVAPPMGLYGWESMDINADPIVLHQLFEVNFPGTLSGTGVAANANLVSTSSPFFFLFADLETNPDFPIQYSFVALDGSAPLVGVVDESATFFNTTLASLGMVEGESLTVTWQGDSATIQTYAIPEPASALMLLFGAGIGMAIHRARCWANR